MTTLLTFRDNIKAFYSRYDYILTPILKFILAILVFTTLNQRFGYMPLLENRMLLLLLSGICAFLPVEILTGIGGIMIVLQSFKVSLDVGLTSVAIVLIFYCGYMRFSSKTGIIVLLVPLFYMCHLTYALPVLLGFLVGPAAIIPMGFGMILYYYQNSLGELVNVLAASTTDDEENAVQGFQYVINGMLENKTMQLAFVIFACVILVTYVVYRLSFEHSWLVSFIVGGFLNVVLFLIGNVAWLVDVEIAPILTGSIVGILLAVLIQFWKGIVDYQRTEVLQFEDDEYYYYVKAIPKLSVSESNKHVKHINSKTQN